MKYRTLLFMLLALPGTVPAQDAKPLTLQQCIDTAISRNISVRRAGLLEQTAALNKSQSSLNRLPSLAGFVAHGSNQGRSIDPFTNGYVNQQINYANYGLGADLTLFNGFNLLHARKAAGYAYEAAGQDAVQAANNLTLQVILAYLQVLNSEDLLAQARANAQVTLQQVQRLELLDRQGAVAPPLVFELKGQYQNEQVAVADAQNALELAKSALALLMNKAYDPQLQLERLPFNEQPAYAPEQLPALAGQAAANWPLLQAMTLRRKSAEQTLRSERGRLYPALFFSSNVNTTYSSAARLEVLRSTTESPGSDYVLIDGSKVPVVVQRSQYDAQAIGYSRQLRNNIYSNVELGLRVPLFSGLQTRNRIRQAKITAADWALQEAGAQQQFRADVDQAAIQLATARSRYHSLTEAETAFAAAFRAAEVRFNAGVGTVVDYLIAKNNFDRARANRLRGRYDLSLRKKLLDFYLYQRIQ